MSETDSYVCPSEEDQDQDNASYGGPYINERGDRHSEESSGYHISAQADPSSTNKKYVRRRNPDTHKNVRVEFFPTKTVPNSGIKHAITGIYQSIDGRIFRTGTKDEDLFFSVILATGELGQNAPVLFYDSPEQYERHFFTKLNQTTKDLWMEKKTAALYQFNLRQNREANASVGCGVTLVR
jgi:hypothetical protein